MRIKIRIHQIRWICRIRQIRRVHQVRHIRGICVRIRRIRVLKIADNGSKKSILNWVLKLNLVLQKILKPITPNNVSFYCSVKRWQDRRRSLEYLRAGEVSEN